jgi:hypothetical protein
MIIVTHNIYGRISVMTVIAGKKNNMVMSRVPMTGRKLPVEFTTCKINLFGGRKQYAAKT